MVRIDLVFVAVLALFAQLPAAIHGVLTDASGAVIPGAAVSLSGANVRTTAQTAADGSYSFQGLAAGDYTVFVKATGLEVLEKRITVESGKTAQLVITLRPEVLTQALTVTEEPETDVGVESDKSASAVVIKTTELDTLPDNPDDLLSILQTLAGQAGGGAQILVDNFSGGQLPSKSTIKEIKINQDPFSAAYDWMGFGRIEIVTKPGGDKLHGTFGLTDNDAALNSRNPYAANKADYVNRIITANIGSSFGKRASYGLDAYHSTINNTALINAVTLDPATFAETPVRKTVVVPRDDISGTGRLDLQMSASHTLTGSYRYLRIDRNNNGVGGYSLESRGYPSKITNNELRLTETATLNANAVMDTRFGYTANGNYQYGATSIPSLIVSSAFNGGSAQTGATRHQTHYFEFQNNVSVSHGAHALKFGGRFRYIPTTDISPSNFGGTFSFFGMTNAPVLDTNNQPVGNETTQISSLEQYRRTLLLQGLGYSGTAIRNLGGGASQFSTAAGNPEVDFTQTDFTFYGLDDWRVRQDVTVSLGLRYMTQDVVRDWHGAQPRIAVAWSASPKTVVRAGWGSFYQTIDWPLIQQARRFNGLTEQQYVVTNPDFFPLLPPINSLAVAQSQTTYRLASHFRSDPWMLAAISFDRQLPGKNSISLSYR
ncbi:MAG TPA: TonB-dependent receptor, partial [Terriglobia bacterium]|nr:TonB-dependent receptor [Terriglobia bacterium]